MVVDKVSDREFSGGIEPKLRQLTSAIWVAVTVGFVGGVDGRCQKFVPSYTMEIERFRGRAEAVNPGKFWAEGILEFSPVIECVRSSPGSP